MAKTQSERNADGRTVFYGITLGTVVDVNDPQQMGRIRVMCPALGDTANTPVTNLLWASYAAPFGGITTCGTRGPEQQSSSGPVSYGMWAIPKVGSYAIVMCLDGNPEYRVWMGCLYGQFLPHTMPHGRWQNVNSKGPYTSTENPIEPLASNIAEAFGNISETLEGRTRAADNQVAAVDNEVLDQVVSSVADSKLDAVGLNARKGYQQSRQRPEIKFQSTGGNYDSQVYSFTTPGMNTVSMDDSAANGRIRIRNTNERIYINTSSGKNWIELDKNGNIDIFAERRLSVHAAKGINFKTEGSFIVEAAEIHLNAGSSLRLTSNGTTDVQSTGAFSVTNSAALNLKAAGITMESTAAMELKAAAVLVDRSPEHEPWGRIMSVSNDNDGSFNNSSTLELTYTDPNVGKTELGETIPRNDYWQR